MNLRKNSKFCLICITRFVFRRVRKIAKSDYKLRRVCLSICSSVCSHGSTRLPLEDFYEIWYLSIFRKAVKKIQVSLKSDKKNGYLTWRPLYILSYLAQFILEWEMFQAEVVEKIKTHTLCSITFFQKSCRYEIMWKNIVEQGRPQMKIWRIRIACRVTNATRHTLRIRITYFFARHQWLREITSILRYTYIACLVICEVESVYCAVRT